MDSKIIERYIYMYVYICVVTVYTRKKISKVRISRNASMSVF